MAWTSDFCNQTEERRATNTGPMLLQTYMRDAGEILKLTRQLGIIYGKVEVSGSDDYLVDHSAAIILFDPEGRFRALFNVPHKPEYIAADLQAIKQFYEATR